MSLKNFLWWLSLSVFAAGLGYRFAGPLGLLKPRPELSASYAVDDFSRDHRPDGRLVSRLVGRHSSFWFLTPADRAVSRALLSGTPLMSWTSPDRSREFVPDGSFDVPSRAPGVEAGPEASTADLRGGPSAGASGRK